jgi:hypothetical protein
MKFYHYDPWQNKGWDWFEDFNPRLPVFSQKWSIYFSLNLMIISQEKAKAPLSFSHHLSSINFPHFHHFAIYPRWLLNGWKIGNLGKSSKELQDRIKSNLVKIVLWWSPSKTGSIDPVYYLIWLPWLIMQLLFSCIILASHIWFS